MLTKYTVIYIFWVFSLVNRWFQLFTIYSHYSQQVNIIVIFYFYYVTVLNKILNVLYKCISTIIQPLDTLMHRWYLPDVIIRKTTMRAVPSHPPPFKSFSLYIYNRAPAPNNLSVFVEESSTIGKPISLGI